MVSPEIVLQRDRIACFEAQALCILGTCQHRIAWSGIARIGVLLNHTIELLAAAGNHPKHSGRPYALREFHSLKVSFSPGGRKLPAPAKHPSPPLESVPPLVHVFYLH